MNFFEENVYRVVTMDNPNGSVVKLHLTHKRRDHFYLHLSVKGVSGRVRHYRNNRVYFADYQLSRALDKAIAERESAGFSVISDVCFADDIEWPAVPAISTHELPQLRLSGVEVESQTTFFQVRVDFSAFSVTPIGHNLGVPQQLENALANITDDIAFTPFSAVLFYEPESAKFTLLSFDVVEDFPIKNLAKVFLKLLGIADKYSPKSLKSRFGQCSVVFTDGVINHNCPGYTKGIIGLSKSSAGMVAFVIGDNGLPAKIAAAGNTFKNVAAGNWHCLAMKHQDQIFIRLLSPAPDSVNPALAL